MLALPVFILPMFILPVFMTRWPGWPGDSLNYTGVRDDRLGLGRHDIGIPNVINFPFLCFFRDEP